MPSPSVYSDTLAHDAVLVWLQPPSRDVVGGVQMRTAPPPDVFETILVDEAVTVRIGLALAVADDVPAAEDVTARTVLPVMAVDVLGLGEAVSALQSVLLAAVSDDLALGEAVALTLRLPGVEVVDTLVPDEAVAVRMGLVAVDEISVGELAAVALRLAASVSDAASPTEAVALSLDKLTISVVDAVPVTEQVELRRPVTINVFDGITVEERRFASLKAPRRVKIKPQAR